MITNDRQYKIAKVQIANFQTSMDSLSLATSDFENTHPKIIEAHKKAIDSQLHDLVADIQEYEDLKAGRIIITEINDLAELPLALIKSRIANGLTQAELAERLGLKMQQIQKYEAEKYESASLKTLLKIASKLGLKVDADVQITQPIPVDDFDIKNYPFKQMFKRGWFGDFGGTINDAMQNAPALIAGLYKSAGVGMGNRALAKRTMRSDGKLNAFALDAWYARIIFKARNQVVSSVYTKDAITPEWLKQLREFSKEQNGPVLAAEFLKNSGIRFIIEAPLEGTYLDGAALLLDDGAPVIALTLRYDRLDNFWFVLFHEIAHIRLHLNQSLNVIFDDLDSELDGIEKEADDEAINAIIPNEVWKKSLVRFNPTEKGMINLAKALNISPALIAGRIRKEKKSFYLFTDLIGQGEVRKSFMNLSDY